MKIEVILTPAELPALTRRDLRDTACVVFDVLRATSAFVTALHNGAKAIVPASEIADAMAFKKAESGKRKAETILLGGERDGVRIRAAQAGGTEFDLGNSPREYTTEKVRGKTIISTTTNGTRALRACAGGRMVLAASFLNLEATAKFLLSKKFGAVLIVCAGTHENAAQEDILAAGALCEILSGGKITEQLSDSAQIALRAFTEAKSDLAAAVCNSQNARRLLAIPDMRDDVAFCLQRDVFPLAALMEADGAIRVS